MVAFLVAALVAPAAAHASAPRLPTVTELVERHRHALGRIVATTARWSGTIKRGDAVERFEITADLTGRYRESRTSPLGTSLEGCDGISDWFQDENGSVVSRPTSHAFSFEFALVRLNDFRLDGASRTAIAGPVEVDGRKAYTLTVTTSDRVATLYVDVANALLDGADSGGHVVRYRNYKVFDGTPVPTVIEETVDGGTASTRTLEQLTFGVSVAGAFEQPAPREPAFAAGVDEVVANFDAPHDLIVLRATINEKPVRLLLDSGSSSSVLDLDVAKRLGLTMAGTAKIQGAGELSGTFARIDRLVVAGISASPFIVEAVPLKLPAVIAHEGIDGVLGYDFLSHVVTRIAYYSREVRFTRPSAFKYAGTGAVLPIDMSDRVPYVQASVGQGDKGTFTVDTGSDEGLVLYYQFANAHPRDFVDPMEMSQQSSSGVGGEFSTRAGIVTLFNLGSFTVAQVPTEVVLRPSGAFSPGTSDGLIGAKVLREFRAVFLDYRGKRFILEK